MPIRLPLVAFCSYLVACLIYWVVSEFFQIGLVIFGLSSLAIGLAQNASMMILARAIQGIGSSIIAPTTLALMMDTYTGEMRTKAISYYGATAGIGIKCWSLDWWRANQFCILASRLSNQCSFDLALDVSDSSSCSC